MRQHISYWMLLCRSTIVKILALFSAMTVAEVGLFFLRGTQAAGLEQMAQTMWLKWVFGGALVLMTIILEGTLSTSGSKLDYTLRRLGLGRRSQFLWQSLYNVLCLLLLWAVQLFVAILLCKLWMDTREGLRGQELFLAFYRDEFFHSILPLDDLSRWFRNLVCFICMGVSSACVPVCRRRGKYCPASVAQAVWMVLQFPQEMGQRGYDMMVMIVCGALTFMCMATAWGNEHEEED